MSSKFFTWTKGDRRNASEALRSGGVIPIPVECISIKGLEYTRSIKGSSRTRRKPIPLRLDSSPDSGLDYNGRAEKSVALHDAAVQSATSLMAVMNDMLRSPHMSTHLQQRSQGLQPMYGRPRSHTAPSTPMAEAPTPGLAELPGSSPVHQSSSPCLRQSVDIQGTAKADRSGHTIERPQPSPQGSTYPPPNLTRKSTVSVPPAGFLFPPPLMPARTPEPSSKRSSEQRIHQSPLQDGEDTLVAPSSPGCSSTFSRPSLSVLQPWPSNMQDDSASKPTMRKEKAELHQPLPLLNAGAVANTQYQNTTLQPDNETTFIRQIGMMRASHEAHIASLKEAHERELASQRSYMAFLERRCGIPAPPAGQPHSPRRQLTIDTSHAPGRIGELLTSDASATTMHSFESPTESQKRASQEAVAEAESLKRKLSLARRSQSETGEIRRERDQLRDSVDRSDRRILQLKDIIRKAKDNERALKNAMEDLQARLLAANNERLDVREGYHEACEQVRKLTEQERTLTTEVSMLRSRAVYANPSFASLASTQSDKTHDQSKHIRARSDASLQVFGQDPMLAQLRRSKQDLLDREARIGSLLQEIRQLRDDHARQVEICQGLEASNEGQQQALKTAEMDRDRYNNLLHNELRRQTRQAAQKAHTGNPHVDAEALAAVSETLSLPNTTALQRSGEPATLSSGEDSLTFFKKQLEHCIKEIIMYKLDVKGYKKDLKRATTELELLRATRSDFPPTPDRDSRSSTASNSGSAQRRPSTSAPGRTSSSSGLGISLTSPPKTPTRSVASATHDALLVASPPAPVSKFSPSPRAKTPLGTHKKLPKPPASRTPSPVHAASPFCQNASRGETPRSLSESIISSYGKRGTPEMCLPVTPKRIAGRSSDPIYTGAGFGGNGLASAQPLHGH